ncbi:hypothetical protein BC343_24835 [Mucilaginibacter pedocola]|uniref:SusC/RagA family TonB-linked outer membrane protein n=2 Tax=Mucilaginibacter pedocola TaxID=1792845 RepID=A0A1S9PHU5_9SPHI|nr:hypothetical protein BC343_24835 [Mucilaginibacter pedocola]
MLCVTQVYAQNRTITGTVTSKDDGLPLPGVSVTVTGTTIGVQTNVSGKFTLSVPATAKSLTFSFIGYSKSTANITGDVVNVSLASSAAQLTEVVVTGVAGIKQNSRANSTSAQVVGAAALNTVRQTNLNNALAGKVAGIQVRSQSTAALGRQTEVRLRGATGFGTGRGALYVVDGTVLPNSDDLNPDDIEDVSVLQGPAASAQFGSQGANGVIVITTKKGKKNGGLGIDLNLGAQFDKVYVLPNYQDTYMGGANADLTEYTWKVGDPEGWKALSGAYYPDYSDDSSWGPKMVGQQYIPWYAWAAGTPYSFKTTALTPQPNNIRDFFQTGVLLNNNITFNKAADDYNFKLGYGNQYVQGLIPTQNLKKNTLNINANVDLNKHFTLSTNINYVNQKVNGQIDDGYANQSAGNFNQWMHRDIDMGIMKELKDLKSPDGTLVSWNHLNPGSYNPASPSAFYAGNYWYNPYTYQDYYKQVNNRDRLYGNIALTYKINSDLSIRGTYRKNQTTTWGEIREYSILKYSQTQTGRKGAYSTSNSYSNRENYEFLATYNKKVSDFSINANVGTDSYNWTYKDNGGNTDQGLGVDDLFTLGNSVNPAQVFNGRTRERYNAVLGTASFGWKDMIFLNGTIRNDWFSTLPKDDNAVLSKSFGGSFVFTELLKDKVGSWLSYGKLRASWGEIPNALGEQTETFGFARYPGMAYAVPSNKFNGNILMGTPDQFVDPAIHGAVSTQKELGLDLRFLNDRIGLMATYWEGTDRDFPTTLSVNGASGFSSILTNIGLIKRKGLDLKLEATPVSLTNFRWSFNATYSNLIRNTVVEVAPKYNTNRIVTGQGVTFSNLPQLVHQAGKEWGQLYGGGILRNSAGVPILNANGFYQQDPNVYFGSVLPKHTGGLQNSFTVFKDFTLNVNIDYQFGGKFASLSNAFGSFSGLTARTAALNDKGNPVRDAVADGGGVHTTGVDANGNPVSFYVDAKAYYQGIFNNKTIDEFIYDLTFVKLRELSIGYRIPVAKLGIAKYIKNANFSLVGRDLFLLYTKTKDFDPSQVSAVQGESGQLPGTRAFGFNLRMSF